MQIGHQEDNQISDYKMIITDNSVLDKIITDTKFPEDYEAFNDENLDMIP